MVRIKMACIGINNASHALTMQADALTKQADALTMQGIAKFNSLRISEMLY